MYDFTTLSINELNDAIDLVDGTVDTLMEVPSSCPVRVQELKDTAIALNKELMSR